MLKDLKYAIMTSQPILAMLYHLIRTYCRTFRLTIEHEHAWLEYLQNGGVVILCTWHQQFFAVIHYFHKYRTYHPGLMISQSKDGDMIANVAARSGWYPVRGSSSRGGSNAFRQMVQHLKETRLAAHIVDGPRGPAGIVKPGVIRLAHAAGAVIVPFYVSADQAWYFKSWDRFFLPKPFAHVTLRFGDMMTLDEIERKEDVEKYRLHLETIMFPELRV